MADHACDNCLGVAPASCINYDGPATDAPEQDLRTQIANLVPLSMLDGRDPRANVFEVADEIIAILPKALVLSRDQVAEAIYRANGETAGPDWDRVASSVKNRYRKLADAALGRGTIGAAHG